MRNKLMSVCKAGVLLGLGVVQLNLPLSGSDAPNPEAEIMIVENFISQDVANDLMRFYDFHKTQIRADTDNGFGIGEVSDGVVRSACFDIVDRVIDLIQENYVHYAKKIELDHGGFFARIPPNYASYHNDNSYFDCPVHGKDQGRLRTTCDQTCPGSKFVPNHTGWREYTALLYLNDDFEGGEIVFEDGPCNKFYKKAITIKAGMLVLSPDGPNFYHEVLPMRKGKRYSFHLWFTSDPYHFIRR